jgi:putative transcriptional regulator
MPIRVSTQMMILIFPNSLTFRSFLVLTVNKEELSRKLGKRIVQLREKKNWTQSDLARACIKDRQSIERLESGKTNPTLYTLSEIATALEVSISELLKF